MESAQNKKPNKEYNEEIIHFHPQKKNSKNLDLIESPKKTKDQNTDKHFLGKKTPSSNEPLNVESSNENSNLNKEFRNNPSRKNKDNLNSKESVNLNFPFCKNSEENKSNVLDLNELGKCGKEKQKN